MAYMICGGSFITSRYGVEPGWPNYEAVVYHPQIRKLQHYYRINHADRVDNHWVSAEAQHVRLITPAVRNIEATGPGAIIQSTFGEFTNFHVIAAEVQGEAEGTFRGLAHYSSDNDAAGIRRWLRLGMFARGATAGDLVQNRITGKLEAVALIGGAVYHFEGEELGGWVQTPTPITTEALAPPTLTQSSYSGNLELVVREPRGLVHYVRAATGGPWGDIAVITSNVTGVAGFRQGPHGNGVDKNFEVAVPFHDRVELFWRDNSDPLTPWKPGGIITRNAGPVSAVALAITPFHDCIEVLTQEAAASVFHYYRYVEDDGGQPWLRTSCLKIDEGPYLGQFRVPPLKGPFSTKVEQITGEVDRQRNHLTRTSLHNQNRDPLGTDLGSSFTHKGILYFLFGDSHWRHGEPEGTADSIAYALEPTPAQGLTLEFHRSFMVIHWPHDWSDDFDGARQGEFDVPQDGFSYEENAFVFFSTDHGKHGKTMGRSVLTRCRNAMTNFAGTEYDDPLQFFYLKEFSRRRFINCQVQVTTPEMLRTFKAPVGGPGLLIWGTGAYRADNVYLAFLPLDTSTRYVLLHTHADAATLAFYYFAGLRGGEPVWSNDEDEAVPLFHPASVGELSVRYDPALGAFVMMYMSGPYDPIGEAACLRLSRTPYGPWSQRRKVFDVRAEGYGQFIQRHKALPLLGDSIIDGRDPLSGGGAYAPYQIPKFTQLGSGNSVLIYYVLSTWNPYQVVLMNHFISGYDRALLMRDWREVIIQGVASVFTDLLRPIRKLLKVIVEGVARLMSDLFRPRDR